MSAPRWGDRIVRTCAGCGMTSLDVARGLVGRPPHTEALDRCRDRQACDERCDRRGVPRLDALPEEAPSLALPGFGG